MADYYDVTVNIDWPVNVSEGASLVNNFTAQLGVPTNTGRPEPLIYVTAAHLGPPLVSGALREDRVINLKPEIVARLVMPVERAEELRDLLTRFVDLAKGEKE